MAVRHLLTVRLLTVDSRCDSVVSLRLRLKLRSYATTLSWSTLISISSGPGARGFLSTFPKSNSASVSSYMLVKFHTKMVMRPWLVFLKPRARTY